LPPYVPSSGRFELMDFMKVKIILFLFLFLPHHPGHFQVPWPFMSPLSSFSACLLRSGEGFFILFCSIVVLGSDTFLHPLLMESSYSTPFHIICCCVFISDCMRNPPSPPVFPLPRPPPPEPFFSLESPFQPPPKFFVRLFSP